MDSQNLLVLSPPSTDEWSSAYISKLDHQYVQEVEYPLLHMPALIKLLQLHSMNDCKYSL